PHYLPGMKASTFHRTFSDDEVALALAEHQELPSEQVRRAQQTVRVENAISGAHCTLAEQARDLAVRLGNSGLHEHLVDPNAVERRGKHDEWDLAGDGLQGGL